MSEFNQGQWQDRAFRSGTSNNMQIRRRPIQDSRRQPSEAPSQSDGCGRKQYRAWQPAAFTPKDPVPPDLRSSEHFLRLAGVLPGAKAVFTAKGGRWVDEPTRLLDISEKTPKLVQEGYMKDPMEDLTGHVPVLSQDLSSAALLSPVAKLSPAEPSRSWQVPPSSMPELADTGIVDVCGAQHDLMKVSDAFRDNFVPYNSIAVAGLAGSGKSHCARLFIARVSARVPLIEVLHVEICKDAFRVYSKALGGEYVYRSLVQVGPTIVSLMQSKVASWLVVVDGVQNSGDCDIVKDWQQRYFTMTSCTMITTRQLDIAKRFVGSDGGLFTLADVSSWMASYMLSVPGLDPSLKELLANRLDRQPVALNGAFRLLQDDVMDGKALDATLDRLLYDPSCGAAGPVRTAFRAAAEDFYHNRPLEPLAAQASDETTDLHHVLLCCIARPWLAMCSRLQRESPLAISVLAILSVLARDVVDPRLLAIIDSVLGQQGGTQTLVDHCIVMLNREDDSTSGQKRYTCPKPLYLAVKTWLAREQRLDEAYSLSDTIAQLYDQNRMQSG